ncbi:aminopeptidase P family protein [Pararhodobacter sp. SW119]|uniref:aminopeptidase P family protein n=1 Tax=Pararhodobacter sp. SW119 TaxID=2780075 RepID=UPI001ADEDB12|nr:aminopeptidase P family protein [Pararhodobacter sp. SW119]
MLQSFTATSRPEQGPPRLAALRQELARRGLTGFLVPRADAFQGEYVAARDDRLAWLTGFTGSAGFAVVLPGIAGVFVDGRYRLQVRTQCDTDHYTPVDWPENPAGEWLRAHAPRNAVIAFDPWLHTPEEIDRIERALKDSGISLRAVADNPIDAIWSDQPPPPAGRVRQHPEALAGRSSADKRAEIAARLRKAGQAAVVLTLPDSISWLLNLRGADIPRNPVVQAFAILHDNAAIDLFIDPAKLDGITLAGVTLRPVEEFAPALKALTGAVRYDPATAPVFVARALARGVAGQDPCLLPKACKTEAELEGMRAAHLRDGAAMCEFLCWFDSVALNRPSEIELATNLEECRRATGALLDLSFETISGTGPHGAIVHYRVTEDTNRRLEAGELYLVDSGGQYADGTTDITRTLPAGKVDDAARAAYTRVLQGMIAVSRARFPKGVAGAHLDALARYPLWLVGADYDHGTGHGVGAALSVHEGPVRISRASNLPLAEGMILSNEPGYYRAGAFGIRIENLLAVRVAPDLGEGRRMLEFETLTLAPIDTRMIDRAALSAAERDWLNAYHARVEAALSPLVSAGTRDWLAGACAPI